MADGLYEFIFEDDKCSGKDAVTVAHKLINIDKVDAVIGFACSGAALAALPLYEKAGVLSVVTVASSPKIGILGRNVFRTFPSDIKAAEKLFEHMLRKKHKSIAVLSEETEYAQDLKDAFLAHIKPGTLSVTLENYLPDTTDFKSILLKLKTKQLDGLFINPQAESTFATILQQIRELEWEVQLYGAYWPGSPVLREAVGSAINGVEFVDTPSLERILTFEGKAVLEQFQEQGGKIRSIEATFATTYEGFRAAHQALQDKADPAKFLSKTRFHGVFGNYSFDSNGDIRGISFSLKKIEDGKPVLIR